MSERDIEDLANLKLPEQRDDKGIYADEDELAAAAAKAKEDAEPLADILLHYPQPTPLSRILSDVARWSEMNFVLDPGLNRMVQIFAPRKLDKEEALRVFAASLEISGLRALHLQGSLVKIVPMHLNKIVA